MATDNPKLLLVLGTAIISIVGAIVPVSSNDNLFETFGKKSPICCEGGLYPRESLTRELKSLDGIWNFRLSPPSDPLYGFLNGWYLQDLERVSIHILATRNSNRYKRTSSRYLILSPY